MKEVVLGANGPFFRKLHYSSAAFSLIRVTKYSSDALNKKHSSENPEEASLSCKVLWSLRPILVLKKKALYTTYPLTIASW